MRLTWRNAEELGAGSAGAPAVKALVLRRIAMARSHTEKLLDLIGTLP